MNWPWKKQPIETRIEVIRRDRCKLTLDDWRSNESLVNGAAVALTGEYMELMLDVLRNSHPAYQVFNPLSSVEVRAAHQAKCEGYTLALANLEAMGRPLDFPQTLEPTFESEKPE